MERNSANRKTDLDAQPVGAGPVENHMLPSGPKAGERAPDVEIEVRGERRLLSSLFGQDHVLLVLPHPKSATEEADRPAIGPSLQQSLLQLREKYGDSLKIYPIVRDGEFDAEAIIDVNGEIAREYGAITALYLVRPDGYIAFRSGASQIGKLEAYLAKVVVPTESEISAERRAG